MVYDIIIFGAGLYGLYSALKCGKMGKKVLVLEYDPKPFMRATYINQARVHMGYHYPRSLSTALKSAGYFYRFNEEYGFCINRGFSQIYATSSNFSWTNADQFKSFCKAAEIQCEDILTNNYFKEGMCDGAFLTEEYTYDAQILKEYFLKELLELKNVNIQFDVRITGIVQEKNCYTVCTARCEKFSSDFVLNTTYASVNQILRYLGYEPFQIKYELCEIIICDVNDRLKQLGITVMDGPFFSLMPFGKTGYHSLTAVTFTPHMTSYEPYPVFVCQKENKKCSLEHLENCNECPARPVSAWNYMSGLARKYLREEFQFEYKYSLFSVKPILKVSEIDDSRPTVIRYSSKNPTFVSVLSGKINTVYDLDEVLVW